MENHRPIRWALAAAGEVWVDFPVPVPALRLFLFTPDPQLARAAEEAGVHSVIIDWEDQGKGARQAAHDTEINRDTVADLDRVVAAASLPVTVRVNGGGRAFEELEVAIDHGARVLMLPMARSAAEVERFVSRVNGRAQTLIQIETQSLVEQVRDLAGVPWDFAFIGFNDLMISRGGQWLWEPLLDGTVEAVFQALPDRAVGFGGVTVVGGGYPLRFTSLLGEMARLGCSLSFLRRTFRREIAGRNMPAELAAVQAAWSAARLRNDSAIEADRRLFREQLETLRMPTPPRPHPNPLAT